MALTTYGSSSFSSLACGRLTIDLEAYAGNWRSLRDRVTQDGRKVECAAVVKADAYGISIEKAIAALSGAGCTTFFVATPEEGIAVRGHNASADIYILNGLLPGSAEHYKINKLQPVLNTMDEAREWAETGGGAPAALHIDTGMNRLGLREEEAETLAGDETLKSHLALSLILSHLACADTPRSLMNGCQLSTFREICALFPGVRHSLANSAGIFNGMAFHFDLVRPGIALYGGAALQAHCVENPMRPVVKAEARILQIRTVKRHESVGYAAAETVERDSRIAIVGAGYADGYLRQAGSSAAKKGARAYVAGRYAPLVGRVSMDMIALDITGIDGVERGDYAELFGPHVPLSELAGHAGTIDYEFLTGLGARYRRIYAPLGEK